MTVHLLEFLVELLEVGLGFSWQLAVVSFTFHLIAAGLLESE